MNWIDTHSHLYAEEFQADMPEVIQQCLTHGLKKIYLPNIDLDSIGPMWRLVQEHPELFVPMMGLHPCYVPEDYAPVMARIRQELFDHPEKYAAVGEIGTDLHWDKTKRKEMEATFRQQIEWAIELKKPIVIHSRESLDWNISIVQEYKVSHPELRGIFHCFNGDEDQALTIADLDFLIGIGGVITYKNAHMDQHLKNVPLEYMVLETDAPYLAPVPHRGKRNTSAYLNIIGEKLAEITGRPLAEVARVTGENAQNLFAETKI